MGFLSKITKPIRKVVKGVSHGVSKVFKGAGKAVGSLFGVKGYSSAVQEDSTPAPEIDLIDPKMDDTTEEESKKGSIMRGKKRGKKGLKINTPSANTGRNIV